MLRERSRFRSGDRLRSPEPTSPGRSPEAAGALSIAGATPLYPAWRMTDVRCDPERSGLGPIFLRHLPERARYVCRARGVSVAGADLRKFLQRVVFIHGSERKSILGNQQ